MYWRVSKGIYKWYVMPFLLLYWKFVDVASHCWPFNWEWASSGVCVCACTHALFWVISMVMNLSHRVSLVPKNISKIHREWRYEHALLSMIMLAFNTLHWPFLAGPFSEGVTSFPWTFSSQNSLKTSIANSFSPHACFLSFCSSLPRVWNLCMIDVHCGSHPLFNTFYLSIYLSIVHSVQKDSPATHQLWCIVCFASVFKA